MSIPISEQRPPARSEQMNEVGAGEARDRNGATYEACPWVGTQRDRVPYYAFPAGNNYCYRVEPATSIKLAHQAAYCLSSNHVRCPIYRQKEAVALPDRKGKWKGVKEWRPFAGMRRLRPSKQVVARFILFLLFMAAALLLAAGWYYQGGVAARLPAETSVPATVTDGPAVLVTEVVATPSATSTATVTPTPTPTNTPTATGTKRPAATATDTAVPTATATVTATPILGCVPPDGWVAYVVRPGDSLFRLGQRFGATVGALQQGNCMGSTKTIYVGQRLYVPGVEVTATVEGTQVLPAEPTNDSQ